MESTISGHDRPDRPHDLPRDCYDACGVLVTVRDGASQRRGDPAHPVSRGKLCRKCSIGYNGAFLDPAQRLTQPLRRVGRKGGAVRAGLVGGGAGRDRRRLGAIAEGPGAETILNAHYTGTCSLIAYNFPLRFFSRLGATEVDPDTVCNKAGHVALDYVYGSSTTGFDPRTARDSACIVVWGANPSASAPHAHEHWLPESPGRVIVVDPIRTPTAAAADLHLQPFPGSDAALAFALMHVIMREGLADRELSCCTRTGWDELEPMLAACTPDWGEAVTGVPAARIEDAARELRRGAVAAVDRPGSSAPAHRRQRRCGRWRCCPAVTGNLAKPGAGFLYLNDRLELDDEWLYAPHLGDPPAPVSHMDLAGRLEDADRSQALICWNINIAASNPEQARLRRALERDDLFTVVLDLFATDTADLADSCCRRPASSSSTTSSRRTSILRCRPR